MAQRTQRLIEAARKQLPEGTYVVGVGLLIAGITTYGFQIFSFRALTKPNYAALNGLWVLVFILAPGFFLPLEQEVGRALAHRRVSGEGGRPVVRRAATFGLILTVTVALLALFAAAATPMVDKLFHGNDLLVPSLVIALFTYAVQHLTRGTLSGNGRFKPYGMIIGAEGVIRLAPTVVLAAFGVDDPIYYGFCVAIPPLLASLVALRGQHGLVEPGPDAPWSELSSKLGLLLGGSLAAQVLSYSPFLGAQLLAKGSQKHAVADFIVGFFLARIPILLFQAVQAALLPKLASLHGAGRHDEFRSGIRKLVFVVAVIGVVGVLAGGTLGPEVGKVLFGKKFTLDSRDLALLAGGSCLFILALTLAQALIAIMGHARALVSWLVGIVGFVIVTAATAGSELFLRVELGFIAGAGAAAACMGWQLLRQMRSGITDTSFASLVEQIEHEPLEI